MAIPSGYTPLDFVGFTDRGTYAGNVPYVRNDLVHHGGNIWLVLIDGTLGIVPSESANYTLWLGEPTNLVERIIAPLEDNPATVAYGVGRQIIFNDWLYEVIAPIAVGDALVTYESDPSNANIKLALPVETQVLAIKAEADATDAMIAPNENGSTMSQSYAIGAQFIRGNVLYKAKAAITSGTAWSSLTLNTDYEVQSDSLVEQINTKQPKTLATPITVNNVQQTTVEGALGAINTDLGSTKQALTNKVTTFEGNIAPVENGTNYSKTYNKGDEFVRNDLLYEVTVTSVGTTDAISVGTNCKRSESLLNKDMFESTDWTIPFRIYKMGRTCFAQAKYNNNTPALTANTSNVIGTVPIGFRPNKSYYYSMVILNHIGNLICYALVSIGEDGKVIITPDRNVVSGNFMFIGFTYELA